MLSHNNESGEGLEGDSYKEENREENPVGWRTIINGGERFATRSSEQRDDEERDEHSQHENQFLRRVVCVLKFENTLVFWIDVSDQA